MTLSTKDPAEAVTVTFDFSSLATSLSGALVTCVVASGKTDAGHDAMLSGLPVITGTQVRQRLVGGIDGNTYKLRCQVNDADGEIWVLADTLKVQTC